MTTNRLDAADSAFLSRQLEQMKSTVFEVKREALKARKLFPLDPDNINAGARVITYEVIDRVGSAKLIASYSDDIPSVDVNAREVVSPVRPIATKFGVTVDELASARMANKNLSQKKAKAATAAAEEIIHKVAMNGDADTNLPGFLSNPNIPLITAAATGAGGGGSSPLWANKTGEQMLIDMHRLAGHPTENTNGVETADTMIMDVVSFNLATTRLVGDTGRTVMSLFMESTPYIKDVDWVPELATAAPGGGKMLAVYRRDPEVLTLEIPKEPAFLAPQPVGLKIETIVHGNVGGVIVYYPLACAFMDGI